MNENVWPLILLGGGLLAFLLVVSFLSKNYSLNNFKNKTVGDGQHGTARWATPKEIHTTYHVVPFRPHRWRKGEELPTVQGIILGSMGGRKRRAKRGVISQTTHKLLERLRRPTAGKKEKRKPKKKKTAISKIKNVMEDQRDVRALVDSDDIHCLMIGASGVGKTAYFLYANLEYEKMYPGVKITPEVLAALRASDRQMRRFENELKTERFEADNEKQVARFIPSREDSYERLVEEDRLQFADEEMSVEDAVEYREMIRYLYQALAQLEVAEQALICADFFLMKTEAECAKAAGISQPGYRKRRDRILRKLRKSLKECAPKDFQEILEKWL